MSDQEIINQAKAILANISSSLKFPENMDDVTNLGRIVAALSSLTADLSAVKTNATRRIVPKPGHNLYSRFLSAK